MYFRLKPFICLSLLAVLYVSGCQTQPPYKPVVTPAKPPAIKKELPDGIKQLDRYPVRDWKYIVIHRSATESGNTAEFDKSHRKRGWEEQLCVGRGFSLAIPLVPKLQLGNAPALEAPASRDLAV